jgi:DUF1680 family protein
MDRVRTTVIPYQWEALNDRIPGAEPSYCMRNFKLAAELTRPDLDYGVPKDTKHGGCVFQDSDALYQTAEAAFEDKKITLIPYYAWANRKAGEMTVWLNE